VQRGAEGLLAEVEIQERPRECIQGMETTPVTSPMRRVLAFFLEPSMGESTSRATVILRGAVGGVFLVSGATKFLFDNQGPGRFAKIGLPAARELASFVGCIEISCGALLVVGLLTRLAAVPLVVDMVGVDEVEITRESTIGPSPQGARVVVWPPPRPGSM
jgi:DoxX-like protein